MRALIVLIAALALGVAACGGSDSGGAPAGSGAPKLTGDPDLEARPTDVPIPSPTPATALPITPEVKRQLDGGEVGLFDLGGRTRVRPSRVDFSKDEWITGIRWTRWDATGATGTGDMVSNTCDPSCGFGDRKRQRATIAFFDVKRCDGRRYFGGSSVRPSDPDYRAVSYLRAPC